MPKALHRCVDKVEGTVDNAWAVCNAAMNKKKRKRKKAKGKSVSMSEEHQQLDRVMLSLLGSSPPSGVESHARSMMRACLSAGGNEGDCGCKAVLGLRNLGWQYNLEDDTWVKGEPLSRTFAEKADGKSVSLYYMKDVELMQPGTWKGRQYTADDLRRIANDTNSVLDELRPPMIPEHPITGPAKRGASLGWPKGLYVDDAGSLRARVIKGIPAAAASALERGGYSSRSVGLRSYRGQKDGIERPLVLDHVALTNFPVIKTLEDVGALYEEPAVLAASGDEVEVITLCALRGGAEEEGVSMADANLSEALKAAMAEVDARYQKQIDDLSATLKAALSESGVRVQKLEEDNKALRDARAKDALAARRAGALSFVDEKVKAGVISPAQRPYEEALACALSELGDEKVIQLSEGDKTVEVSPFDLYRTAVSKRPTVIRIGRESGVRRDGDGDVVSAVLSEASLVARGHKPEDAKRLTDAIKNNALVADLDDGVAASLGIGG